VSTSASVADEPHGDPAMVETFTPRSARRVEMDEVGHLSCGDKASMNFPAHPNQDLVLPHLGTLHRNCSLANPLEKARIQKDYDRRKAAHDELKHRYDQLSNQRDKLRSRSRSRSNTNRVGTSCQKRARINKDFKHSLHQLFAKDEHERD
jgi:hypothetical protein